MDGKVNKKFYTKNGCFAWACEKDICWMLGFFLSLSKVWGKKFSEKKSWKAYAWYRKHIKITQNGFFDRAHAFDAVICPLQQFMYPLFFYFFFSIIYRPISFLFFVFVLFFTSILFCSFCEFCVGIQWKKIYLLMQVNIQARTYKKKLFLFFSHFTQSKHWAVSAFVQSS